MRDPFRLGRQASNGEFVRHVHPKTYRVETTNGGGERLRIGVEGLPLLRSLLTAMAEPFWILYLHLIPRTEEDPGRYQSAAPWSRTALDSFLTDYATLLETDARYEMWIKSVQGPDLLVYDRHEIVFAYGDLDRFRTILEVDGYRPGDVLIPNPHEHPYREENDDAQKRLFREFEWTHFPLQESDGS